MSRASWMPRWPCVVFVSCLNVVLAVLLVLSCKLGYDRARLPNLSLTLVHLAATMVALRVCVSTGLLRVPDSAYKAGPSLGENLTLALLLCTFMALPNLSLEFNSAGTSLLLRLVSLPATAWLQWMLTGRRTRTTVKLSLVPVGAGVALNALGDVRYSGPGLAFGLSGAMAAACYQTLSADQQSRFDRPSWHLLQSQLRWALPALASQVVFLEPPWRGPRGLLARTWTPLDGVLFAGSTAVGVLLTLSMQWLLGRTSALSYQVLGHVKTCASLVACALLLDQPLAWLQQLSVVLTLCGAFLYTIFRTREEERPEGPSSPLGYRDAAAFSS
ncbi:solute carrier family 35 member E3 [Ixodes scapularis]|uniref:solute carrier family 35 member E3 n=1 Tax=Ixodes scapularis TaxID=6945 RepID=UPI001A9F7DA6|nr:solute carrier family 35 member E3 [Ixodes scapularis]